jgi:hypothetical protein
LLPDSVEAKAIPVTSRRIVLAAGFGLAGLAVNFWDPSVLGLAEFQFGAIFYLLLVLAEGRSTALVAAAIASSRSIFAFGHPVFFLVSCGEVVAVHRLVRRGVSPLWAVLGYWLVCVALIIVPHCRFISHLSWAQVAVIAATDLVKAVISILVAALLLQFEPVRRMLKGPDPAQEGRMPFHRQLAKAMASVAVAPILLVAIQQ